MSNIEKLYKSKNRSKQIFASTILVFRNSQGFYGRLCRDINEMCNESFTELSKTIEKQNFQSTLDVIFWLEC